MRLREETRNQKVVSSNPSTEYWMDIFHIYLLEELYYLCEKTKINKKEAGIGPFLKKPLIHLTFN